MFIAFVLPIILGFLLASAATVGIGKGMNKWLEFRKRQCKEKFKQLDRHGSVALPHDTFLVKIRKDGKYGRADWCW